MIHYLCVITYQYEDRVVEIPGNPSSRAVALATFDRNLRLTFGSEHVVSARVFDDQSYAEHLKRRTAQFGLVAL